MPDPQSGTESEPGRGSGSVTGERLRRQRRPRRLPGRACERPVGVCAWAVGLVAAGARDRSVDGVEGVARAAAGRVRRGVQPALNRDSAILIAAGRARTVGALRPTRQVPGLLGAREATRAVEAVRGLATRAGHQHHFVAAESPRLFQRLPHQRLAVSTVPQRLVNDDVLNQAVRSRAARQVWHHVQAGRRDNCPVVLQHVQVKPLRCSDRVEGPSGV